MFTNDGATPTEELKIRYKTVLGHRSAQTLACNIGPGSAEVQTDQPYSHAVRENDQDHDDGAEQYFCRGPRCRKFTHCVIQISSYSPDFRVNLVDGKQWDANVATVTYAATPTGQDCADGPDLFWGRASHRAYEMLRAQAAFIGYKLWADSRPSSISQMHGG